MAGDLAGFVLDLGDLAGFVLDLVDLDLVVNSDGKQKVGIKGTE